MSDMTTEELFEQMAAHPELYAEEELITPVNDLLINPETLEINVPDSEVIFGAYRDHDVARKYFKCPKIVQDNLDLSKCYIFINYVSASGKEGQYMCEDVAATEDDNYVTFSWELKRNVFDANKDANIFFSVQAKMIGEDRVFDTRKAQGKCYENVDATEAIEEEYADVILQIIARIDNLEKNPAPEEAIKQAIEAYFAENPLTAEDVRARPDNWMPTAQEVGAMPANTKIPSKLSDLSADTTHRTVTDVEKQAWNNKSNFSGAYKDLIGAPSIPGKTSDLQNDSDFQTGEQVQNAVNTAINQKSHFRFEKVENLPSVGEDNIIYLLLTTKEDANDLYDEYLFTNGKWERIGGTDIDLSGYALKSEIPTVPDTLPNPKSLTINIGEEQFTYNGSGAVIITIPSASGKTITERIEKLATDTEVELQPNKLYIFPEMTSLGYALAPGDPNAANEYHFIFQSGATPTEVVHYYTVNTGTLTVEANKIYEISIMENMLTWQSWEVQSA